MADATELARVVPEVRTLARPASGPLLAARGAVQRNPVLRAAFELARTEKHTPERLAGAITPELERVLEATPEEAVQVAQYLADEYFQIGDAVLVIDRMTGRALARFTDDDIWTPAPVPREGGGLAQPLPRLRPDIQGFLVSYYFDQAKDAQTLARVQERYPQTLALRDEGNPRLRAVTRAGRANMTDELRDMLPALLGAVQGAAKAFLDHFEIRDNPHLLDGLTAYPMATAVARSQQSIADPLTFNLRHDWVASLAARIGTSWTRNIATRVASMAHPRQFLKAEDICREALEPADFWVVPPHAYTTFMPFTGGLLPVEDIEPTGLVGHVGIIVVSPSGYTVQAREVFSRYEVVATLDYTLYLDPSKLQGLLLPDMTVDAMAEIV